MDSKERAALIRRGNELFNSGEFEKAEKIFVQTGYRDGLMRLADHLFYEKRQPLFALKYYRMVNHGEKIEEIFQRMVFALGQLLGRETGSSETGDLQENLSPPLEEGEIEVKVHPRLKILAEEILRNNGESINEEVKE